MRLRSFSLPLLFLAAFAGAKLIGPSALAPFALPAPSAPTAVTATGGSVVAPPAGTRLDFSLDFDDDGLDDAWNTGLDADDRSAREREEVRLRLREGASGTYIDELLIGHDSSLARWPERTRKPLRIWIQPEAGIADWQPWHVTQVRAAFERWTSTVDIPVRFAFVTDSARADIHVGFVHSFDEAISGKTIWARDENWWIVDADINIAVHYSSGEALDESAVFAITLHEVGHLLGLDHCSDQNNIMSPRVRVRELSAADRATAQLLYTLPPGAVR